MWLPHAIARALTRGRDLDGAAYLRIVRRALPLFALLSITPLPSAGQGPGWSARREVVLAGRIHRDSARGCGQSWQADESWTDVALRVRRDGRAELVLDARIRHRSGGVSLLGDGAPYHSVRDETRRIVWRGRATGQPGRLRILLGPLVESGTLAPGRSHERAVLQCATEESDVLAADRPPALEAEPTVGRRSLLACAFFMGADRNPAPVRVASFVTVPFFLAEGSGVTTDARYDAWLTIPGPYLVAREPGGLAPPADHGVE